MLINSKVAKLYRYLGDPAFDRIMSHINAAQEEGLEEYEVDTSKIDDYMLADLMDALDAMEFDFSHDEDGMIRITN